MTICVVAVTINKFSGYLRHTLQVPGLLVIRMSTDNCSKLRLKYALVVAALVKPVVQNSLRNSFLYSTV